MATASRAEARGRLTSQHAVVPSGNGRDRFFSWRVCEEPRPMPGRKIDGWHAQTCLSVSFTPCEGIGPTMLNSCLRRNDVIPRVGGGFAWACHPLPVTPKWQFLNQALFSLRAAHGFGKAHGWHRHCHPEAQPKELATEGEVSLPRSPDPSLCCAPFWMTNGGARMNPHLYYIPVSGCHVHARVDMFVRRGVHAYASVGMAPGPIAAVPVCSARKGIVAWASRP
jgi:hypothetical protein